MIYCCVIDCHWFARRRVTEHTVSRFDYYPCRLEIVFQDVKRKPDPRQTDRMKRFSYMDYNVYGFGLCLNERSLMVVLIFSVYACVRGRCWGHVFLSLSGTVALLLWFS